MASQPIKRAGEITWLLFILLVLFPAFTAFFWEALQMLFGFKESNRLDLGMIDLTVRMTLVYYSWYFLLFILLPYSLAYQHTRMDQWHVSHQLLLFYMLLWVTGALLGELSLEGLYTVHLYPQVLVLYLLLTLTIGPLVNIPLRWRLRRQSNKEAGLTLGSDLPRLRKAQSFGKPVAVAVIRAAATGFALVDGVCVTLLLRFTVPASRRCSFKSIRQNTLTAPKRTAP